MLIDGSGSVGRSKRKRTSSRKIGEDCKAVLIAAAGRRGVVDISRRMNNYQSRRRQCACSTNESVHRPHSTLSGAPTLAHRSHVGTILAHYEPEHYLLCRLWQ
jgi:hypothetical protein